MDKKVFIIHGWGGTPEGNWFPWLAGELRKKNIKVTVPRMPNADFPQEVLWTAYLREIIGKPDENLILVGHSLGAIAILRYLETIEDGEKIGAAVFVSGFAEPLGIPEIENFFDRPVDFSKVKNKAGKFVAINSDDDNYVPLKIGRKLADGLDAEFIVMKGAGHIMAPYGKYELPISLEKILEITQK